MSREKTKTHHIPVCDFGPGHVLDGDLPVVPDPDAGVDGAEAALAEDLAHAVRALEGGAAGAADVVLEQNACWGGEKTPC